jgi:DNA-binding NarL/FixJ family response regulator
MSVHTERMSGSVSLHAEPATVHVFSRFDLIAQTVAAGLTSRGLRAHRAECLGTYVEPLSAPPDEARAEDVAVLIDDLEGYAALRWACGLVGQGPAPWLVLTAAPPGPIWGALLQAGACAVLPSSTSLEEVERATLRLFRGEDAMDTATRTDMLSTWVVVNDEQERLAERLERLSAHERRVLVELYDGVAAPVIADRSAVSEATVRSRIKAVLRKLGVHSQVAAVAALHVHREFVRAWGVPPDSASSSWGSRTDATRPDEEPEPPGGVAPRAVLPITG